ncbi:MAG TPA: CDP-glycerol glycerophosphotransferase family protein, partial [Christiangramia sp.]|nr:CDP-glycerol glycerophosphotransferase family protein [Christiangramia sp.]
PEDIADGFYFSNRYLNLAYNSDPDFAKKREKISCSLEPVLTKLTYHKDNLHLSGYLFIPGQLSSSANEAILHIIKYREENIRYSCRADLRPLISNEKIFKIFHENDYRKFWQKRLLHFTCVIDLKSLKRFRGFFKFWIEYGGMIENIKNYYKSLLTNDHIYALDLSPFGKTIFTPYCYDAVDSWRLDIYTLNTFDWIRLKCLFKRYKKTPPRKDENTWLIGEYNNAARDNGLHFFKYVRKHHPQIKIYYVIYQDSPDRKNLHDSNVVFYGTYKHFKIAAKSKVLIFTHSSIYLVPKVNSIVNFNNKFKAFYNIFLEHGVIATTPYALIYRKELREYDRFIVSSTFEKKIVCEHFGYNDDEVSVTGLARWDNLLKISRSTTDILIIPTWRNDLDKVSDQEFKQSKYFKFWNTLFSSKSFLNLLDEHRIQGKFFLHFGLSRFAECFSLSQHINQVTSENIQELLATCGLLITDYSSVAFDVLYQEKPVIFCPFDYPEMLELRPGPKFIEYEKDLPGPICSTVESIVQQIIRCINNDFQIEDRYRERLKTFFDHVDRNNCRRIYENIADILQKNSSEY